MSPSLTGGLNVDDFFFFFPRSPLQISLRLESLQLCRALGPQLTVLSCVKCAGPDSASPQCVCSGAA